VRKAKPEEVRIIRDHHEGYISVEQWTEIRAILATSGWSRDHANLGTGVALAQEPLRCWLHANRRMSTRYKHGREGWRRSYGYRCRGDYVLGGPGCGLLPGVRVDEAVTQAVLERLSRPTIAAVRAAFDQAVADARAEQRHRMIERARLQQRVTALEEKLDALDPDSFHALESVERPLEEAKRDLVTLDAIDDAGRARTARADAAMLAEAEKLDVLKIWNALTTTDRDRKELIRMLVRRMVVEDRGPECVRLRIRWTDGTPDRSIDVWLQAGVERLVRELVAAGRTWEEAVSVLNGMGIKTRRGNPFTAGRVQQAMWRQSRKADRRQTPFSANAY